MKTTEKNVDNLNILALIPARGGSQRVANKNVKILGSKPLINYTIGAAKKSKYIQRVIVSTNCEQIAQAARAAGAELPFMRPDELSGTHSTEFEFHQHAVDWLKKNENYTPDLIVNLYPTSPFRTSRTIDKAIELFLNNLEADSLRSVTKCSEHPYKMWTESQNGHFLEPFIAKKDGASHTLSYQMLPKIFIQNASIYITKPSVLEKFQNTIGEKVLSFEMDELESVDINNPIDFITAETVLELIKKKTLDIRGLEI